MSRFFQDVAHHPGPAFIGYFSGETYPFARPAHPSLVRREAIRKRAAMNHRASRSRLRSQQSTVGKQFKPKCLPFSLSFVPGFPLRPPVELLVTERPRQRGATLAVFIFREPRQTLQCYVVELCRAAFVTACTAAPFVPQFLVVAKL